MRIQISTSASTSVPKDSLTKIVNYLVKEYAGRKQQSLGSNPYAAYAEAVVYLTVKAATLLKSKLHDSGWTEKNEFLASTTTGFVHTDSQCKIQVTISNDKAFATVIGPKKAKRTTIPHYD